MCCGGSAIRGRSRTYPEIDMYLTLAIAATPAFLASLVEWAEAFTIVVAVGNTRGWRGPLFGVGGGFAAVAGVVLGFGGPGGVFEGEITPGFPPLVGRLLLLLGIARLR